MGGKGKMFSLETMFFETKIRILKTFLMAL